jgi:thiamine biosynthesis lipoprotein
MATRCRPLLGTYVEITAPGATNAAIEAAFDAVAHVHRLMSFHEAMSDLGRLRRAAADSIVAVDRETALVLRFAGELRVVSGGVFDVGVGRRLVEAGFLPADGLGSLDDYPGDGGDIEVLDDTHVRLRRRTLIDLGGIAKGYAVDRAVEVLMAAGVAEGLVNAGGDLRVFGPRAQVAGLRDADGRIQQTVELRDGALASSAYRPDRRRNLMASPFVGRHGGFVVDTTRVSVVAPTTMLADAMTKIAMADPSLSRRLLYDRGGSVLPRRPERAAA